MEPAVARQVGPVQRRVRRSDSARLQGALGHQFPGRPVRRDGRLRLLERRRRQDRALQHGGAAAGQDRRLRGIEEGGTVEDRRGAEEEGHSDPPRFVHRSGVGPPCGRGRSGHVRREGLRVRRGEAGDQGSHRRTQDREPDLQHHRRSEGQDSHGRFHRQQGHQRQQAREKDEGQQGAWVLRVHHRGRHLSGSQVRRRRAEGDRLLPRARLCEGAGRPARAEDHGGRQGRQDALHRAADSGHRRAALQDWRPHVLRQQRCEERRVASPVQVEQGGLVQRKVRSQGI